MREPYSKTNYSFGTNLHQSGDSIRYGAFIAAEDETVLEKVELSIPLFKAYTNGYMFACGKSLSKTEMESTK